MTRGQKGFSGVRGLDVAPASLPGRDPIPGVLEYYRGMERCHSYRGMIEIPKRERDVPPCMCVCVCEFSAMEREGWDVDCFCDRV
jgi:hypothetical protein